MNAANPGEQCLICKEVIKQSAELTKCGHSFCFQCLNHWLSINPTCPQCRRSTQDNPLCISLDMDDDDHEVEVQVVEVIDLTKEVIDLTN